MIERAAVRQTCGCRLLNYDAFKRVGWDEQPRLRSSGWADSPERDGMFLPCVSHLPRPRGGWDRTTRQPVEAQLRRRIVAALKTQRLTVSQLRRTLHVPLAELDGALRGLPALSRTRALIAVYAREIAL